MESRARIIETAEELFASHGFEGVSIREIADRAQVNSASIYYYFRSKDELYHEIIENSLQDLSSLIEAACQQGKDPVDRLRLYITSYIKYLQSKTKTAHLVFQAVLFDHPHLDEWVDKFWGKHYLLIESILVEGVEQGYFRPIDTRLTAINLRGMILWYFMMAPIIRRYPGMEGYQQVYNDQLTDCTLDLLLQGLLPEKRPPLPEPEIMDR